MRAEARLGLIAGQRIDVEAIDVEEAIAQGHVGVVGNRLAKPRDDLPRKSAVAVVEEVAGVGVSGDAAVIDLTVAAAESAAEETR